MNWFCVFSSVTAKRVSRFLSHDPSVIGEGALLGDRATMINSQDDRVFMRSMATRGQAGGLSPATESCLAWLAHSGFDYVIIETVGTGQEALPFRNKLVDQTVLVMNPDYGVLAVAKDCHARCRRHCRREQNRSGAG